MIGKTELIVSLLFLSFSALAADQHLHCKGVVDNDGDEIHPLEVDVLPSKALHESGCPLYVTIEFKKPSDLEPSKKPPFPHNYSYDKFRILNLWSQEVSGVQNKDGLLKENKESCIYIGPSDSFSVGMKTARAKGWKDNDDSSFGSNPNEILFSRLRCPK